MKICSRHNVGEFKTDSQPGLHLYASDFSLQITVATDFTPAVLGINAALWGFVHDCHEATATYSKPQALKGVLRQNFTMSTSRKDGSQV